MACTLADLLIRRTRIAYETSDHGIATAEKSAIALSTLFAWDAAARREAVSAYSTEAARVFSVDA
jgi:glycerol-3-phosphate dehydrogenase